MNTLIFLDRHGNELFRKNCEKFFYDDFCLVMLNRGIYERIPYAKFVTFTIEKVEVTNG